METLLSISGAEGMSMLNNSNNSNLSKSQGRPRVNMKPKTPLAQRLQLIFRECNFSVAAEKMGGISSKTAKAYMTGDTDPTASVLAAIVTNMGCRSDWLLLGKAPVFPEGYGAGDQVSESSDLFLHSIPVSCQGLRLRLLLRFLGRFLLLKRGTRLLRLRLLSRRVVRRGGTRRTRFPDVHRCGQKRLGSVCLSHMLPALR